MDLDTIDGIHTWSNERRCSQQITFLLDGFIILESLMLKDMFMEVEILPYIESKLANWPRIGYLG